MTHNWQPANTIPTDGETIEVQATMLVHFAKGAKFDRMPLNIRPESSHERWHITAWRYVDSATAAAASEPERDIRRTLMVPTRHIR